MRGSRSEKLAVTLSVSVPMLNRRRKRTTAPVISPTLGYACGTWTLTNEHERMTRSTQRKMLRLIVQTRRKYKKEDGKQHENQKSDNEKEKESQENFEGDTQEGSSTDTDCDQDSDVSFAEDSDKEIDTAELEQEDCIEYMKRSTAAEEEMRKAKIPCWI